MKTSRIGLERYLMIYYPHSECRFQTDLRWCGASVNIGA